MPTIDCLPVSAPTMCVLRTSINYIGAWEKCKHHWVECKKFALILKIVNIVFEGGSFAESGEKTESACVCETCFNLNWSFPKDLTIVLWSFD